MKPMPGADEHRRLGEIENRKAEQLPPGPARMRIARKRATMNRARIQTTGAIRICTSRSSCCAGWSGALRVHAAALSSLSSPRATIFNA
jgi:hypothetical protein